MPFQHHPRQVFPHRPRGLAARQPVNAVPDRRVPRKAYTDRLGIPADATNAQVLSALDKVIAPRQKSLAASLAKKAWGQTAAPADAAQDALYRKAWG